MRIILVRHGKPNIQKGRWIDRRNYTAYMQAYERAGLDPASIQPPLTRSSTAGMERVFASQKPRSIESAKRLLPDATLVSDPVFDEAPLRAPAIPLVRMHASTWMILARLAWHAGYHGDEESWMACKARAMSGMRILWSEAQKSDTALLVAHGYINFMIGIRLHQRGWRRIGTHRFDYWNTVVYERKGNDPAPD